MAVMTQPELETYSPQTHIVGVRFQKLGKLYHFDYSDFPTLITGDFVIVATVRGLQMGQVVGFLRREDDNRPYKPILRIATPRDLLLKQQWQAKEVQVLIDCREAASKIRAYADIKFIKAEYTFDGSNLLIMYTSEDEIDIYPLRNALKEYTAATVDFRQIGPRDVARIMGGQGACGGPRCCSTFLTDFSPISIKMAKAQGIPLNPTEITGMCGRLRCCLVYEYEQYVEARRQLPKRNKVIGSPHGEGRVVEVFPIRDGVTVQIEDKYFFVEREQIIPLDEFRALQDKAAAGCSKNETGACDCGARRPKSAQQDLSAALEMAHTTINIPEDEESIEPPPEKPHHKSRRPRRRSRREQSETKQTNNEAQLPPSEGESEEKRQPRHRRRRSSRRPRNE